MSYMPPLKDMQFVLEHVAGLPEISGLPGYGHATPDVVEAVLGEAAKLASEVWAPLNRAGDQQGARMTDAGVKLPEGYKDAYLKFVAGGWNAVTSAEEHGGQGLPWALGMAVNEMWQGANLALGLCPLLTAAAVEAIEKYGTPVQKEEYLPKMVSGEWTGTMHLTEPQAGTDLAAIRTVARKTGDHYLMKGQKIFITFGEHDFTPNIIHLVLARVDGLPEGNDGLGLFIVPKFLSNGKRNDVRAVSLEHKLGIHGSPTCVMMYGEGEGAVAYLLGQEGHGLRNMFTMMNNARISVGLQGVALAESAYQHALSYAKERVQGFRIGDKSGKRVTIIGHADVRRMLLAMKAQTMAARALAYYAGGMIDRMRRASAGADRAAAAARVDLLTPLVKAFGTDGAVETASTALQVHGGMGFIEETGAAQYYRDARILPIYEGTNGIQSNDLVFRKVLRDGGAEAARFLAEMRALAAEMQKHAGDDLAVVSAALVAAVAEVEKTTGWVVANGKGDMENVAASAVPYQRQFSLAACGFVMAKMAMSAQQALRHGGGVDADFLSAKIIAARFFAEAILPQAAGLTVPVMGGHKTALQIEDGQF